MTSFLLIITAANIFVFKKKIKRLIPQQFFLLAFCFVVLCSLYSAVTDPTFLVVLLEIKSSRVLHALPAGW